MKYWAPRLAILALLSTSLALAEDFKTINGKEYKNATVSRVEPDAIVLKTKSGITKVYFTELPKEVQERFHYDSAKAAQFRATEQAASAQSNAAARQEQQQQQAEAINKNVRTVLEVESDKPRFLDHPFLLKGTIEIATYYNWGYEGAEQTHYAFYITDSTGGRCHAYMERAKADKLRQQLLSASSPLNGVFTVVLLSDRYVAGSVGLLVELLDYHLGQ